MTYREYMKTEREGTRKLNRDLKRYVKDLPYGNLRKIYGCRWANAETRRRVRAEAKRRGYKLARFGG